MASCSRWRGAPAPADAPRWTELSSAPLPLPAEGPAACWPLTDSPPGWGSAPPSCRGVAMLRRRRRRLPGLDGLDELALAHPAGAGDAHRLRDPLQIGQQHAGQPGTAAAGGLVGHRLTGRGPRHRCCRTPRSGEAVCHRSRRGDASGVPEEPVKSSVVSLTRGPSQGAGVRPRLRPVRPGVTARRNRPGQVLQFSAMPVLPRRGLSPVSRPATLRASAACLPDGYGWQPRD